AVAERHVDPEIGVFWARFQQQHRMLATGAQPVCEHAAGRSGADDDVIIFGNRTHESASSSIGCRPSLSNSAMSWSFSGLPAVNKVSPTKIELAPAKKHKACISSLIAVRP